MGSRLLSAPESSSSNLPKETTMSTDHSANVLNGLTDRYAEIFGPKYADLYRKHIGQFEAAIYRLSWLV